MKDSEWEEFCGVLLGVAEAFGQTRTKAACRVYWDVLKEYDLSFIEWGLKRHMQDEERGHFMPVPADILKQIKSAGKKPALIAWQEVCDAMLKCGQYVSVKFADGVVNQVLKDMGGWNWICNQNIDEPWTQKEFERRYQTYSSIGLTSDRPLFGVCDLENMVRKDELEAKGFKDFIKEPVLIPDTYSDAPRIKGKEPKKLKE